MTPTSASTATDFDWTAVSHGWDLHRDHIETMKEEVTRQLLSGVRLQPGERVLELAAGTGELSLKLASVVGPTGHVIATDAAAGMVELLRAALAGTGNAEVAQLDARATGLPDGSVDAVVMRMGLMLVDDPSAVLRECRRVLAPAGRLGVAVWAGPEHNPWMTYLGMAAMMNGLVSGGPPTGPGGLFSLADAAVLEARVRVAGFRGVTVTEAATTSTFAGPAEYFDTVSDLAGPLSSAIAAAPEATQAAVRRSATDLARAHVTDAGLVLAGRALVCTGTV
jgi:SAM-dependent methyltransferase